MTMRVVFHYDAGPELARRLAELSDDGLDIAVCPAADDARFRALMTDADVLWHVLRPLSAADIAAAPRAASDPEDRRRGQHHRPRRGARPQASRCATCREPTPERSRR